MKYVCILESLNSEHFYIGITSDLRARLAKHNAGEVPHTSKYGPWRIRTYVAFSDEALAIRSRGILNRAPVGHSRRSASDAPFPPTPQVPH